MPPSFCTVYIVHMLEGLLMRFQNVDIICYDCYSARNLHPGCLVLDLSQFSLCLFILVEEKLIIRICDRRIE